jgi:phytol kinase
LTQKLILELPYTLLIGGVVIVGLWLSNTVYDFGVPHYLSRKIGHFAGGFAFLIAALNFSSALWPLIISVLFTLILLLAKLFRPGTFRGVGGSGRKDNVNAEIWFPFIAVVVFGVSWLWLGKPLVALSSLLFMAWGDGVTGLVRWQVYHRPVKGLWGSVAMLFVCLLISWVFLKPFWIGAVASIAATMAEWTFGDLGFIKHFDDNWTVPLISMTVILGLMSLTANI